MSFQFHDLAARANASGTIDADDLLALRREGWADGRIDQAEAEAIVGANAALTDRTPQWCDFFVEALNEYVVNSAHPRGYVSEDNAEWLIGQLGRDGQVEGMAELELLVKVAETALSVPGSLRGYALAQIERAVLTGEGPTRHGELSAHGVTAAEADLMRRLIFAPGSEHPLRVSRAEAEMLYRIKDATLYEANDPAWDRLFVQGVANYLLGFDGHEPLSRERAAELEGFMASEGAGLGVFLAGMASPAAIEEGFGSLLGLAAGTPPDDDHVDDEEDGYVPALDAEESDWLHDKLDADEDLDPLEKALIAFIAEETGQPFEG